MIESTLRFDDVEDVPGLLPLLRAVQRSRMWSRERSGRRPGNEATLCQNNALTLTKHTHTLSLPLVEFKNSLHRHTSLTSSCACLLTSSLSSGAFFSSSSSPPHLSHCWNLRASPVQPSILPLLDVSLPHHHLNCKWKETSVSFCEAELPCKQCLEGAQTYSSSGGGGESPHTSGTPATANFSLSCRRLDTHITTYTE